MPRLQPFTQVITSIPEKHLVWRRDWARRIPGGMTARARLLRCIFDPRGHRRPLLLEEANIAVRAVDLPGHEHGGISPRSDAFRYEIQQGMSGQRIRSERRNIAV